MVTCTLTCGKVTCILDLPQLWSYCGWFLVKCCSFWYMILWSQNEKIRIIIIIIVELHTFQALQMKFYHQIFPATTICYYVPYKLLYNLHIQSVNKMLAKKLIDDKTRDYMNARRVAKVILDRHHGKEAGKTLKSLVLE